MHLKTTLIILIVCVFVCLPADAKSGNSNDVPSKINVYSENGERFTLFVNSVKQNTLPAATVEVKEVRGLTVKLNVMFENTALAPVAKTIVRMANECSYVISKNKKGVYSISMKTAGTLGTQAAPASAVANTDSMVGATISKIDSMANTPPVAPIITGPSGTTTLAQTDASKSKVLVNGRPADASVKVDNATGKVTLGATNDKGEGAKVTLDLSKLGEAKNGFHEPEVKIGGMTTDEFSNTMGQVGDGIGNALDPENLTTTNRPASASNNVTTTMSAEMAAMQKETEAGAAAAMERAANPKPVLPGTFTFSAEEGEKFTLYISNIKQNTEPQMNVVVNNVLLTSIPAKVIFENSAITPIEKKLMRMGKDCVYSIKKNKKGEYVLKIKSASGAVFAE